MNEKELPAVAGPVERMVRPGSEAPTLVKRLRERAGQYDEYAWHSDVELEAAAEIERLHKALRVYFAAADAAWVEVCQEASKRGITYVPVMPAQAKAMDQYNELRRVFGA